MQKVVEWPLWSAEQIVDALPGLLAAVEAQLSELPAEHYEKNRGAVEILRDAPPGPAEVRDGSRSRDLTTLGFALDVIGRRAAREGDLVEALRLFQAAHELFRRGNPLMRATRPMRQTLGNAVRAVVVDQVARCRQGETDVPSTRAAVTAFVHSAWGTVPTQLSLAVDEMILLELERARLVAENDAEARDRLVRDHVEAVLQLEVPTRLERIRREWEALGERIAPAAVRRAQRAVRRPEPLSALVPPAIWAEIRQAVERGDADALGQALADVQDELEMNLRLRLDAKPEPREPASELRVVGAPDPAFLQARELLLRQDPRALEEFSNLHYRRSANTIAKEWYAHALVLFGQSTDIHDIIELLEAAIASDRFHEHRGWTARWNLACALRRLPSRADEALDVLLPVLRPGRAPGGGLRALPALGDRAGPAGRPGHALCSGRVTTRPTSWRRSGTRSGSRAGPRRRGSATTSAGSTGSSATRIASSPTPASACSSRSSTTSRANSSRRRWSPPGSNGSVSGSRPDPRRGSSRTGTARPRSTRKPGTWRPAGAAGSTAGASPSIAATWTRARRRSCSAALLGWAQRHGFREEGLRVLRQSWSETSFAEADAQLWAERLGAPLVGAVAPEAKPEGRAPEDESDPAPAAQGERPATSRPAGRGAGGARGRPSRSCWTGRTSR